MKAFDSNRKSFWQRHVLVAAVLGSFLVLATIDGHTAGRHDLSPPASSEFGLGPRPSVAGLYTVTLQTPQPLRPRQLQTLLVLVEDASARGVDGVILTIGGGMPQHGHGLPTRPRVTRALGNGRYEIEGVRFNMGGWWEFSLGITGAAGSDSVTFNLDL